MSEYPIHVGMYRNRYILMQKRWAHDKIMYMIEAVIMYVCKYVYWRQIIHSNLF